MYFKTEDIYIETIKLHTLLVTRFALLTVKRKYKVYDKRP